MTPHEAADVGVLRAGPYRCPGCDKEAFISVRRHTMPPLYLSYSISCERDKDTFPNQCLGQWFGIRHFDTETSAVSEWNNAIIEMAASALGITTKEALGIKESRLRLTPRGEGD